MSEPTGELVIPPTATPDPARILRVYVDDESMRPKNYRAQAGKPIWFMLVNLGQKGYTLRLEGKGFARETRKVAPQKQQTFGGAPMKRGEYRLFIVEKAGEEDYLGRLQVE